MSIHLLCEMQRLLLPAWWQQTFSKLSQSTAVLASAVVIMEGATVAIAQPHPKIYSPQIDPLIDAPVVISSNLEVPSTFSISSSQKQNSTLPQAVREAVLSDVSNQTSLPASALTIVSAEQRRWPNGCLGLSTPNQFCTQVIVPGWQVVVSNGQQEWTYRTDESGSQVRLAENSDNSSDPISLGQTCTNETVGYTIRYPSGWETNSGEVVNQCQVFDPDPISLPARAESLDEAVHIRASDVPYSRVTQTDEFTATELSRRTTTVDGRPATVVESEATGRGLVPEGIRIYSYNINLGDQTLIATTYEVQGQDYERNKQVLDQMIDSIVFNRSQGSQDRSTPTVLSNPGDRSFTIAELPNGNYRFCSDAPPTGVDRVSGVCFRFRKAGEDIIGDYYYPYEGSSICLTGQVNGNTVTGQGLELPQSSTGLPADLPGENQRTDWRQDGFLQVGRAEVLRNYQDQRGAIRYRSALLNLSNFYQYNAGMVLPPQQCF